MEKVRDTSVNDKVAKVTNISKLLDINNKLVQVNTTQIILENNETNKLTFIQMLEDIIIKSNWKSSRL